MEWRRTRKLSPQSGKRRAVAGLRAAFRPHGIFHGVHQHRQP
jgi:hypothetical protein